MRINFLNRIPLFHAIVFSIALMVLQIMEGTSPDFAMLHATFIVISVLAFNLAGGMSTSSGWYIFFFSTLTVLLGTVSKALLGEPADTTSANANLTMAAFTVGVAGILLAISASRPLTKSIPSVAVRMGARNLNYKDASLGCTFMGLLIIFMRLVLPAGPGSIVSAITQLDIFLPLAILLGTVAVVQDSNGRRSLGVVNLFPLAFLLFAGIITFTKQGMITPIVCWLIGVAYARFRLKAIHFVSIVVFTYVMATILYPIAQIGRDIVQDSDDTSERVAIVVSMLQHLNETQEIMKQAGDEAREYSGKNYFTHDVGLLERFTRWPGDDDLIAFSAKGHYIGYRVITDAFLNWFPHALLPSKDATQSGFNGNYYAHELGGLSDDDTSTGISFSPVSEAFHIDGWFSLIIVAPLIWFLLFLSIDLLCGDIRESPWGLFFAVAFAHVAPEGSLGALIAFIWHGNLSLFVGMLFCFNAAPFVGAMLTGASRRSRSLQKPSLQTANVSLPALGTPPV